MSQRSIIVAQGDIRVQRSNFPSASITRRTHVDHKPILLSHWYYLTKFYFFPLKAYRHIFQWLHCVISLRAEDYGTRWCRWQIAWLKLRDFIGYVVTNKFMMIVSNMFFFLYSCSTLSDELSRLWRLAVLNPCISGKQRQAVVDQLMALNEAGTHPWMSCSLHASSFDVYHAVTNPLIERT